MKHPMPPSVIDRNTRKRDRLARVLAVLTDQSVSEVLEHAHMRDRLSGYELGTIEALKQMICEFDEQHHPYRR